MCLCARVGGQGEGGLLEGGRRRRRESRRQEEGGREAAREGREGERKGERRGDPRDLERSRWRAEITKGGERGEGLGGKRDSAEAGKSLRVSACV